MRLTLTEARRLALAAQGFTGTRPRKVPRIGDLRNVIRRLGLVQLDYVNVLLPAHYLVFYSRLGPYDRALFQKLVYGRREFTEQWAHEASVIPVETWPLLRHRMAARRIRPYPFESFVVANPDYCHWVIEELRRRGPLSADELSVPDGMERRLAESWYGTVPRATLEMHFARGLLAVVDRRASLARVFDLAERHLPQEHFESEISPEASRRALLLTAARAYGVATATDLADYFRMPVREALPALKELVASGLLVEVTVDGWKNTAYQDPAARLPKAVDACALLAPFDPLIWFRPRTQRLFGFEYRFEIFVPPAKRQWGAYVLPLLLGDRLVARVDVKAERETGRLNVGGAFLDPGMEAGPVASALAAELHALAAWLGLSRVSCGRRGNLAAILRRTL